MNLMICILILQNQVEHFESAQSATYEAMGNSMKEISSLYFLQSNALAHLVLIVLPTKLTPATSPAILEISFLCPRVFETCMSYTCNIHTQSITLSTASLVLLCDSILNFLSTVTRLAYKIRKADVRQDALHQAVVFWPPSSK